MSALTRYAGQLALIAGAIWVLAILIQIVAPTAPTWIALFGSMLLIGGAALGLYGRFGPRIGGLGRAGALATAVAAVVLIGFVVFVLATGQAYTTTPPPPIVVAVALLSFVVWLIGNVALAMALMRAKVIEPISGWLIVVGALLGIVVLIASGQNSSPLVWLPVLAFGIGWMLLGYAARTPAAEPGLTSQAS